MGLSAEFASEQHDGSRLNTKGCGVNEQTDELAELLNQQAPDRLDAFWDWVEDEIEDEVAKKTRTTPEPIADTIKAAIHERKLTAYAVGKMSGVSPNIISRWLNDERGLTLRTTEKLATALDMVLMPREQKGERP